MLLLLFLVPSLYSKKWESAYDIDMGTKHSPKIKETPKNTETPMDVETPKSTKRKPEEEADVSNGQVLRYMKNMKLELSTDIKDMKSSMSTMTIQIEDLKADFRAQIDTKFSELNVEIDCVKQKINDTNLKVINNTKLAEQNQKFINIMQQEKLRWF